VISFYSPEEANSLDLQSSGILCSVHWYQLSIYAV